MLNVKIILGSTRQGRFSEKTLPWIHEQLGQQKDIVAEVLDLRDFPMPFYESAKSPSAITDGNYGNDVVNAWSKKIKEADAFIFVAPEYDHSMPAVLKNSFDHIYYEWHNKPIGFVSYGGAGGTRSVEHIRAVAVELHMASVRGAVHIPIHWTLLDEQGNLKPDALAPHAKGFADMLGQLTLWGTAFKQMREKSTS